MKMKKFGLEGVRVASAPSSWIRQWEVSHNMTVCDLNNNLKKAAKIVSSTYSTPKFHKIKKIVS